jgi:hypothetical protein
MIGPRAEGSTGDGALVADAMLGDATALTGELLAGPTLDGDELGNSLDANGAGDEAALEIAALVLGAAEAAWCDPEHADSNTHTTTAGADQTEICRRARRIGAAGIPHSRRYPTPAVAAGSNRALAALWGQ